MNKYTIKHSAQRTRLALIGMAAVLSVLAPAQAEEEQPDATPVLLEEGTRRLKTPDFSLELVRSSQTVAALKAKAADDFDFTPNDWLERRAENGYHHLGDLTLSVRAVGEEDWQEYDSARDRKPVDALPASGQILAAADLSPTLPEDFPVRIGRSWELNSEKQLVLKFKISNTSEEAVEIGALGIPMIFNNIILHRSLEEAHAVCSFADPYIGGDAGYLQVTPLRGTGPALLVLPEGDTPFELWQPLDEPLHRQQTFEGMLSWTVHSRALAEKWDHEQPWCTPTSATLKPGESRVYGVRFVLAPEIRAIEKTLVANDRPVAVGVPGYVLPMDLDARLFLNYSKEVEDITVEPAGAVSLQKDAPTKSGWQAYTLRGNAWGRARITVRYADGLEQVVHYNVIKPAAEAISDMGNFLFTKQWFDDPSDPFHRSPCVINYDRELDKQLTQESRAWFSGLSDEAGAGAWLAASMKEFGQPDPEEVAKFERFVNEVVWGQLQLKEGPNRYGVRKSLFYYDPETLSDYEYDPAFNWTGWASWDKKHSEDLGRGYNYPHVVAAYWSLYRLARNNPELVKSHDWEWYLTQAFETISYAFGRHEQGHRRVGYVELGLMEGTVFLRVLEDLQREGWSDQADEVETLMKERADRWKGEAYPFGSEMAWDSTGQEEVYAWCDYFGYDDKAQVTLNAILGYMPTVPHWGYNGNARRYWDFLYGAKDARIERQLHHYGSSLNAIPVLSEYRENPDDYYLLRVGYGGTMGVLCNIDQEGFPSAAFHSFPDYMDWDPYTGDYGTGFFGHSLNTATYIVDHPEFGWIAFGGNLAKADGRVTVEPKDSFRKRVYIAPAGLWLSLDAGLFTKVEYQPETGAVRLGLEPGSPAVSTAHLRIEQPAKVKGVGEYKPAGKAEVERGGYSVPLKAGITWVVLKAE